MRPVRTVHAPSGYVPRHRLIARLRKAVLAGRISLQDADAALAVSR